MIPLLNYPGTNEGVSGFIDYSDFPFRHHSGLKWIRQSQKGQNKDEQQEPAPLQSYCPCFLLRSSVCFRSSSGTALSYASLPNVLRNCIRRSSTI